MNTKRLNYQIIECVGDGTFAMVYKAKNLQNGKIIAVKKMNLDCEEEARDGINRIALREIKLLQELNHKNLTCLLDVFGHINISLVFDFMDTDLEVIIRDPSLILSIGNVKCYMIQILEGLEYLHLNWILHRDLKPNNLLVNIAGVLKIADFGEAKIFGSPSRILTPHVVTRWYRSPELLYGAKKYGTGVDMWAVGCILGELLLRVPLFPGCSDLDQLNRIFEVLGNPTEENWPDAKSLKDFFEIKPISPCPLKNIFIAAGDDLLDVLENLLVLNPAKRKNCRQCLNMSFFSNKPGPTPGSHLPLPQRVMDRVVIERNAQKRKQPLNNERALAKRLFF